MSSWSSIAAYAGYVAHENLLRQEQENLYRQYEQQPMFDALESETTLATTVDESDLALFNSFIDSLDGAENVDTRTLIGVATPSYDNTTTVTTLLKVPRGSLSGDGVTSSRLADGLRRHARLLVGVAISCIPPQIAVSLEQSPWQARVVALCVQLLAVAVGLYGERLGAR